MLTRKKQLEMRDKKQKYTVIAQSLVFGLPMLVLLLLFGCQTETPLPQQDNNNAVYQEHNKLLAEWNDIYDNVDTTIDESVDMEVWGLREKLNPHGISVFRVDPYNPQHRKRYERHLMSYPKKDPLKDIRYQQYHTAEMTDWQIHKVHTMPSNGTLFDKDCPFCETELLKSLINTTQI